MQVKRFCSLIHYFTLVFTLSFIRWSAALHLLVFSLRVSKYIMQIVFITQLDYNKHAFPLYIFKFISLVK